ncbi:MAG: T9SS type A sorting domain-containing protein [Williamsia sp.]|nr:T9SS type A sorting domain-containing protein [Williamsia sp.]
MKAKITLAAFLLCLLCQGLLAQLPLVYKTENTGTNCTAPPLPSFSQLPVIVPLTDPFAWSNGSGRSTNFSDWECRRNEIKAEIENYEIGMKPPRPDSITASFAPSASGGVLTVVVTKNGQTLTLTSQVALPTGSGPFPAVIGMNSPSGSVPAAVFTGRNIARITFSHNQVTTYPSPLATDPFYKLYPDQNFVNAGQYSAWSWGVSRIIDGLELVQASLPIDLSHIGVTGCSYAGKMALYAGAFDERIALTIAQESGGGGAPAWRVSHNIEPNGSVEKIDNTDYRWFRDSMALFSGDNVYKLPHDHHELMAMIAPRALLVTGNTDFTWLSNKAAYVSARATKEVYKTFGIADRFGFYIDGGHGHCAVPATQVPAMQAFVDKFLAGNTSVNTDTIMVNPFPTLDYQRWYQWWGTGNPVLPAAPPEPLGKQVWLEAECATVGADWDILADTAASNSKYVVVKSGLNSTTTAPSAASGSLVLPFTIDSAANYSFSARVNCPTADDDSYWVKVDNGAFATVNGLNGTGWQWVKLVNAVLPVGAHTLTIAYREDGAKLDKILVASTDALITGKGSDATNCITNAPLPLKLLNYQATLRSTGDVLLRWSTSSELNNKQYRVERSENGRDYVTIATVAGRGTFNGTSEYSYTDLKPAKGTNYYRIIQVDIDGHESVIGIKAVNVATSKAQIQVYPNPAHSVLNIDLGTNETSQAQIRIYDFQGKTVFNKRLNVVNGLVKINLDQHPGAGVYLVKIGDTKQVNVVLQ